MSRVQGFCLRLQGNPQTQAPLKELTDKEASRMEPPGPESVRRSGKAGRGQGSAGCDSSRAQLALPQFLYLNNRKGPSVPGCGMQPSGCFPNCSPGRLALGARPGLSYGGTKKIWGPSWGQVEGRPHTQVHRRQAAALPSAGQEGAAATHVQPGTWTSTSLASCPICTPGTLNYLL